MKLNNSEAIYYSLECLNLEAYLEIFSSFWISLIFVRVNYPCLVETYKILPLQLVSFF